MVATVNIDHIRGAQATALMVLAPKALYAEIIPREEQVLDFSKARDVCQQLSAEGHDIRNEILGTSRLRRKASAIALAIRSQIFEHLMDRHLRRLNDPVVVQFGCGLSDRSARYKDRIAAGMPFYDIDFPDMIALRQQFYVETERYRMIAADLSKHAWVDQIQAAHRTRPFLFVAEGVSPYLNDAKMQALFATLKQHFPGCLLIFDTYSRLNLMGGRRILSRYGAKLAFSNDNPAVMEAWGNSGEYRSIDEINPIASDFVLKSRHLPGAYRWILRAMKPMGTWSRWHKAAMRGVVVQVFQLGQR